MPAYAFLHMPSQVRQILDLVQSKGEEVAEFLLHVLQQLTDAYVDLRPWISHIGFSPSRLIQSKRVLNTDPGTVTTGTGAGVGIQTQGRSLIGPSLESGSGKARSVARGAKNWSCHHSGQVPIKGVSSG